MIQLENKSKKFTCPSCGAAKKFKHYVDDRGEVLGSRVGRCDREISCGYHYTPKQFFADNPDKLERSSAPKNKKINQTYLRKSVPVATPIEAPISRPFDFIPYEHFKRTLAGFERNAFVQFLLSLFPHDAEDVQTALRRYFVGTFETYTSFPCVDERHRITKAKLIKFNPETGRRLKGTYDTSSLVAQLKRQGKLAGDFNYKPCYFGEHLLHAEPGKPVAIVESEKSAIIASMCRPEFIWLAIGSKQSLKVERLQILAGRKVVLYPDADGFTVWQEVAKDARRQGIDVRVSNLIETHATPQQKANGYDLADYLISEQTEINRINKLIDAENAKLEAIQRDPELNYKFSLIIDERTAILMESNNLSEQEAERICTQPESVWSAVRSMGL